MQDNKKLNQGTLTVAGIGLLLFLVYAVGIYLFVGHFTSTAIISLVFAVVAFVCTFAMPRLAVRHPDVQAVFFGIPLMGFALYYFFAEVFVSVVFIMFQDTISFKLALFIQLVLFVAFLVISIVSFTAQGAAAEHSEQRRQEAVARDMQTIDVRSAIDQVRNGVNDPTLLRALEHLSDTVRYSDPFGASHPAIAQIEATITDGVRALRNACAAGDVQASLAIVQQLEALYQERNSKLLLVK